MAKYDLTDYEKNNFNELSEQEKIKAKKLFLGTDNNAMSRDKIAKQLGRSKASVQKFFKYLESVSEYEDIHKRNLPKRIRTNEKIDTTDIKKDYAKGMTERELQQKYHKSIDFIIQLVREFDYNTIEKHNKALSKKRINEKFDNFLERKIKHKNFKIYCRIRYNSEVRYGYGTEEHITKFVTVGIRGKGDIEKVKEIIYRDFNKIIFEANGDILCKDYSSGLIFPFSEIG